MNFRRIEWIFLMAFVVLDLFLFFMSGQYAATESSTTSTSSNSSDTTILKEMRTDGITFSKPSKSEGTGYYISADNQNQLKTGISRLVNQSAKIDSSGRLTSNLATPLAVDSDHPEKRLNQFLSRNANVYHGSEYVYSPNLSGDGTYVFVQKVADGTILSSGGQIHFRTNSQEEVASYTQTYLQNVTTLREKDTTISQRKALLALYQYNQVTNNSKIMWSQLGYTRLLALKNNSVFVPTWVFAVKNKNSNSVTTHRINAFTGAAMKNSTNASSTASVVSNATANGTILLNDSGF